VNVKFVLNTNTAEYRECDANANSKPCYKANGCAQRRWQSVRVANTQLAKDIHCGVELGLLERLKAGGGID
jgi:hypothetical protein